MTGGLGALARGYRLGQVPFPALHRDTVAAALDAAWRRLLDDPRASPEDELETILTTRLHQILGELKASEEGRRLGFTRQWFETVVRDGSVVSFDGGHHEKKPDLVFRLAHGALPSHDVPEEEFGLVVECKPIAFAVRRALRRASATALVSLTFNQPIIAGCTLRSSAPWCPFPANYR